MLQSIFNTLPRGGIHHKSALTTTRLKSALTSILKPTAIQLSSLSHTPATPPPKTLETERKFAPTPSSIHKLRTNTPATPFKTYAYCGARRLRDQYFDDVLGRLMERGVYLRRRSSSEDDDGGNKEEGKAYWEIKIRKSGTYTNSSFEESRDVGRIEQAVRDTLSLSPLSTPTSTTTVSFIPPLTTTPPNNTALNHLPALTITPTLVINPTSTLNTSGNILNTFSCVADIQTHRTTYTIQDFTIVLDTTNYGHTVGEVELESTYPHDMDQSTEKAMIEEMHGRIENFMAEHPDVFPVGKVEGKLSAWFRVKEEEKRERREKRREKRERMEREKEKEGGCDV
ncbi:hypothetical protein P280DRAFT_472993 [Massarina eburnea CBS 473.64]|uniref:CYTH domain-containing protein n=1 Tax=Massarina eburnea CBS 473.64 TaxID=1395130 RepID=A0A6A6RME1_9PLEO|nr:hypothetical protein P280DRAFT_472993 [Massarina eburnea CBS 473.64]